MFGAYELPIAVRRADAQNGTTGGIISSDTTWTRANSPYSLKGNVLVDVGATLTIEPGARVNCNNYYIMVEGTLTAKGTSDDKIFLTGGEITLTSDGTIIQNAVISMLFNSNGGIIIKGCSPAILNNDMNVSILNNGGSPIIHGNNITGVRHTNSLTGGDRPTSVGITVNGGAPIITDNTLSGAFDDACISIEAGSPVIERNLISDSTIGLYGGGLGIEGGNSIVENNTFSYCFKEVASIGSTVTLAYNNFLDTSNYTIYGSHANLNASNNWWGTTDPAAISQKIWDFNDDFNIGKVTFTPFLNVPNPNAAPNPNAPIPTPSPPPTQSSSPTTALSPSLSPTVPEFQLVTVLPLMVVSALLGLMLLKRKLKH
jgi:hypothetical protein